MNDEPKMKATQSLFDVGLDERNAAAERMMRLRRNPAEAPTRIGRTRLYLSQCNPAFAGEVAQRLQRFYDDFPYVAAQINRVEVLALPNGCYAGTHDDGAQFSIALNGMVYGHGEQQRMEDHVTEDYLRGFHKFNSAGGNFEHELGHVIDLSTGSTGARQLDYLDAQKISGYAVRGGPEEAFAEAFANWREGISNGARADGIVAGVMRAAKAGWGAAA